MPGIHVLSAHIANQIAAGEVVERPCSVVKELVENAVDAHATAITVETENGGIDCIRVLDNGCGIPDEDCETAFLRHATSKIFSAEDLYRIATLGFRGEALASIAAVSRVKLTTRTAGDELGTLIRYEGGDLKEHSRTGCTEGTCIEVRNLFYNVPARLKFLKSARAESGAVGDYVARLILSLPQVAFHYAANGKTVYQTVGDGSLRNALLAVYGVGVAPHLCPVLLDDGYIRVEGFVGTPELSRPKRSGQTFFLNGRLIRSNALSAAVARAFDTRLLIGRYPFCTLRLSVALAEADVNVHPAKLEVRFTDEGRVVRAVCAACTEALIAGYVPAPSPSAGMMNEEAAAYTSPRQVELRSPIPRSTFSVNEASESTVPGHVPFPARIPGTPDAVPRYTLSVPKQERPQQQELFCQQGTPFTEPFFIIGSAFSAYWFVQQGEAVYCIDQHAAHERLLYDALMAKRTATVSQTLLMPETVTLLPSDYALYQERKEALEAFGFVFSELEENKLLLAAVPQLNGVPLKSAFLLDVLHDGEPVRAALTQQACKHAVKAGEPISRREVEALLTSFSGGETLLTCPHGRPVAVRIHKLELEKWFKRIP